MMTFKEIAAVGLTTTFVYGWLLFVGPNFTDQSGDMLVQDYSKAKLEKYQEEGRSVFVKVGADWCKYCKLNDVYFKHPRVINFFVENNIVMLIADMSDRNIEAENFLQEHKRMGIPFYVFYPNGRNKGIIISNDINSKRLVKRLELILKAVEKELK